MHLRNLISLPIWGLLGKKQGNFTGGLIGHVSTFKYAPVSK